MFTAYRSTPYAMTLRKAHPRRHFPILMWAALACLPFPADPVASQDVDQKLWGVDPGVTLTAAAVSGNTLYVGGSFVSVAPVIGGGAITDPHTGLLRPGS